MEAPFAVQGDDIAGLGTTFLPSIFNVREIAEKGVGRKTIAMDDLRILPVGSW